MSVDNRLPRDVLFLRWGNFRAGAIGRPAICTLALIALALSLHLLLS